jgi:hypothetical protein
VNEGVKKGIVSENSSDLSFGGGGAQLKSDEFSETISFFTLHSHPSTFHICKKYGTLSEPNPPSRLLVHDTVTLSVKT